MTKIADPENPITRYHVIVIRRAIKLYRDTGLKANTAYTPTNMLRTAGVLMGKDYKRGQLEQAQTDLEAWLEANPGE